MYWADIFNDIIRHFATLNTYIFSIVYPFIIHLKWWLLAYTVIVIFKLTSHWTLNIKLESFAFQLPSLNCTKASSFFILYNLHISKLCGFQITRVRVVICMCFSFSFSFLSFVWFGFWSGNPRMNLWIHIHMFGFAWTCGRNVCRKKNRFHSIEARFRSDGAQHMNR